ncbi:MAG: glutathione peroxidase [Nitrospirae bacterium]|nr:glutathione peroxidase [Nitrospirota bacterium]
MNPIYEITCHTITGEEQPLSKYKDRVLLIVNTASKCGFTPQFLGLETLYKQYQAQGFEVLGFPCNQFGSQDPGNEEEILNFCRTNYDVSFPMFSKIEVNGPHTHPLFHYLKKEAPGLMGSKAIKWNFTKFLIDKSGSVQERFAPTTKPEDIAQSIEALLHASSDNKKCN